MVWTFIRSLDRGNARNWPGVVVMEPGLEYPAAVWAQEYYEAKLKLNPANTIKFVFSAGFRRDMEILGHEIEVQAAVAIYRVDEEDYRRKESEDLAKYDDFKDKNMKPKQIYVLMENVTAEASRFVKNNKREIMRHDDKA